MGRGAEKLSQRQRQAIATEALDNGRKGEDIANNGIRDRSGHWILEPRFVTPPTARTEIRKEAERRRRADTTAIERAGDELLWDIHDECRKALKRHRDRKDKDDMRQLVKIADIAARLERAIASRPRKPNRTATQTTEANTSTQPAENKPSTLADQLGTNGNGNNGGAVQSQASADGARARTDGAPASLV